MEMLEYLIKTVLNYFEKRHETLSKGMGGGSNWWNELWVENLAERATGADLKKVPVVKGWAWPTLYKKITLGYGKKIIYGKKYNHKGVDIKSLSGPCFSVCDGVIKKILRSDKDYPLSHKVKRVKGKRKIIRIAPKGRGWTPYIAIKTEKGTWYYKHVSALPKYKVGKKVIVGEQIGDCGNLGYSFGPHLHLEFKNKKGIRQNSEKLLLSKIT